MFLETLYTGKLWPSFEPVGVQLGFEWLKGGLLRKFYAPYIVWFLLALEILSLTSPFQYHRADL